MSVQAVAALLDTDRRQKIRELGQERGLSLVTFMHILKNRPRIRKIESQGSPSLKEEQRWIRYDATQTH